MKIIKQKKEDIIIDEQHYLQNTMWMNVEEFIKKIMVEQHSFADNPFLRSAKNYVEALYILSDKRYEIDFMGNSKQSRLIKNCFKGKKYISNVNEMKLLLYNELLCFEEDFKKYLIKTIETNPSYNEKVDDLIPKIIPNEPHNCYILDFNYTKPNGLKPNQKQVVNFIHGNLETNIIIGFDGSDLKNTFGAELQLTKSWQKLFTNSQLIGLPKEKDFIKSIIFYGHSLGEEDYSYFHALFDYYDIYSNDIKLLFYYSDYESQFETPESIKAKYISSIQNLLNKYAISSEKEKNNKTIISKLQLENRIEVIKV